jgi:pilus assembly protein CpaC
MTTHPISRILPCLIAPWLLSSALAIEAPLPKPVDLLVALGRGVVVDCPNGVMRISTSNPEIVDAITASGREVLFHTRKVGQATLFIWSKTGERMVYEVTVEPNLEPMRRLVRETFPTEDIDIRAVWDSEGKGMTSLALVGKASGQAVADRALALVASTVKGAVSTLQVAPAPIERQVLLRVRFAELNRTAIEEFGVNLLSTGMLNTPGRITTGQFASGELGKLVGTIPGNAAGTKTEFSLSDILSIFAFRPDLNLGVLIQNLQTRGLLQILAEPNLVATNGKEASFLAGGEFPIPIAQSGANSGGISVMFREYGIRLAFLPVITANNTIKLHVRPEVSTIDTANGVTTAGFSIPALSTRRMDTDIELGPGQSFVIGGLIDDRVMESLFRIPGLSNIPILGALFKSRSLSKTKTELVVVVTPEIAAPVNGTAPTLDLPLPLLKDAAEEVKSKR